jgi:hypothetical protein
MNKHECEFAIVFTQPPFISTHSFEQRLYRRHLSRKIALIEIQTFLRVHLHANLQGSDAFSIQTFVHTYIYIIAINSSIHPYFHSAETRVHNRFDWFPVVEVGLHVYRHMAM